MLIRTILPLPLTFLGVRQKTYLHWWRDNLFLMNLFAEDGVKEKRGGTVVDQPGRLLQGLQICPLLTNRWLLSLKTATLEVSRGFTITILHPRKKSTGLHRR